ncbi:hypothetical protein GL213_10135 [Halogeometricum borinquense]|nr:hypothetical protein GL213_10135 [Halogeometricum borinquense]
MTTDTDPRRPLAAFDGDVIARVAREMSIEEATLREAIAEHQRGVRSLPGVEDIVYRMSRPSASGSRKSLCDLLDTGNRRFPLT